MSADLVSIATPLYNSSAYIGQTIESVLSQTYTDWEMIIVDDCSADNSREVAQRYAKTDDRIKVIALPANSGTSAVRNLCVENSWGRYIAFLDSDDLWLPDKLEVQIEFMKQRDCVFSCTAYRKVDESGNVCGGVIGVPDTGNYRDLLRTNFVGNSTAVYDSGKLGKVYLPDAKEREDYGLWLKILRAGYVVHGLNECLMLYRVHRNSSSRNKLRVAYWQWQVYRNTEKLPLLHSISCFMQYAYHGYMKSRL